MIRTLRRRPSSQITPPELMSMTAFVALFVSLVILTQRNPGLDQFFAFRKMLKACSEVLKLVLPQVVFVCRVLEQPLPKSP